MRKRASDVFAPKRGPEPVWGFVCGAGLTNKLCIIIIVVVHIIIFIMAPHPVVQAIIDLSAGAIGTVDLLHFTVTRPTLLKKLKLLR